MKIRQATNQDTEDIRQVVFSVLSSYGLKPDPNSTDFDLNDISKHYLDAGGEFWVVEDQNGQIVGCSGLYSLDSSRCELRKMYLLPQARGKGLGKTLLKLSIERAKELGFSKIELETASVLKEAISLYEAYGFKPYDADHLSERCDQSYFLEL